MNVKYWLCFKCAKASFSVQVWGDHLYCSKKLSALVSVINLFETCSALCSSTIWIDLKADSALFMITLKLHRCTLVYGLHHPYTQPNPCKTGGQFGASILVQTSFINVTHDWIPLYHVTKPPKLRLFNFSILLTIPSAAVVSIFILFRQSNGIILAYVNW